MPDALTPDAIKTALADLPGWTYDTDDQPGKLSKTYTFDSFKEAAGFIFRIAFEAEAMNHHPELFNVYNTVKVGLSTHDADGQVTQLDVDLARKIESVNWIPQKRS